MKLMKKTFKKIILDDLKEQGLHRIVNKITSIKYKSYSGGCSVDVKTVNLFKTDREILKNILDQYKDGDFNSMEDIYEYRKDGPVKERYAKYVFLNNEFTQDIKDKIKEVLAVQWDIHNDKDCMEKSRCWYDQKVHQLINELEN